MYVGVVAKVTTSHVSVQTHRPICLRLFTQSLRIGHIFHPTSTYTDDWHFQ